MMEKLQRLIGDGPVTAPVYNALLDVIDGLREHVDHLYGCVTDIAEWTEGVDGVPRLTFRQYKCPPLPPDWCVTMTADEAVGIVVFEFTRAYGRDKDVNARLARVEGRIIRALREHRGEGR